MKRFDPKWQLRRCVRCGHEERFPALCPVESLCSWCGPVRFKVGAGSGRTMHVVICLCGCGAELVNMTRRDTLYAGRSHSTRAWKARSQYDARRAAERASQASPARC
ncbi:hypothetical protein DSM104299_03200 [Baekduia alba]|nr:hypothetical protein DSM104299_03200 [Baekduia alba]